MKWDYGRVRTGEDGGFPGLFEIVTIVGWLDAVASIAFAFCSCGSWNQVKVATVSKVCLPSEGRAGVGTEVHEN